jgi:(5-formylfuran-3-yl)methyl phosphate synthase
MTPSPEFATDPEAEVVAQGGDSPARQCLPVEQCLSVGQCLPTRTHPRLLVSVRNQEEAMLALSAGVDIVDLKEPGRGPLAPTDRDLWQAIAKSWPECGPNADAPLLSAALGECDEAVERAGQLPARFAFAKAGPSTCRTTRQLGQLWAQLRESLNSQVELVAVAYADWRRAECPPPQAIFELAAQRGMTHCLLDTWKKDGVSSLQILGESELRRLDQAASHLRLRWILAGSIRVADLRSRAVLNASPYGFGVRGDVCGGIREGALQADRIRVWIDALQHPTPDR